MLLHTYSLCNSILLHIESTRHHEINNKFYRSWFDENEVPIVMDNVKCDEDDKNILDCSASFIRHNCNQEQNIWLQCKGKIVVLFINIIIT